MDYLGYTASGTYTDTFSTAVGCDSIRTLLLEVILPVESQIESKICDNETHGYTHPGTYVDTVSYTHLRAHETVLDLVCRLLLEKKKNK